MDSTQIKTINSQIDIKNVLLDIFSRKDFPANEQDQPGYIMNTLYASNLDDAFDLYVNLITDYPQFPVIMDRLKYFNSRIRKANLSSTDGDQNVSESLGQVYSAVKDARPYLDMDVTSNLGSTAFWNKSNYKESILLMGELLRRMNKNIWRKRQQIHFDSIFSLLTEPDSYFSFLSFTRKNAQILNKAFEAPIREFFRGKNVELDSKWGSTNFLVDVIHKSLKRYNLSGTFYDEVSIEETMEIKKAVETSLQKTLTLVQVINLDSFANTPTNWPFYEYTMFNKHLKECYRANVASSNYIFIVTDNVMDEVPGRNRKDDISTDFHGWYDTIKATKYYKWDNVNDLAALNQRIEALASTITQCNKSYYTNIPARLGDYAQVQSNYTGRIGETITILLNEGIDASTVKVSIIAPIGNVAIESGDAAYVNPAWVYTARKNSNNIKGAKLNIDLTIGTEVIRVTKILQ